jgi:hypothetical protein
MFDPIEGSPMLVRFLMLLLHFPRRRGESDIELVERWLEESEPASGLVRHLSDEADLLDMAADMLIIPGDEALDEIAHELGNIAHRLRVLVWGDV